MSAFVSRLSDPGLVPGMVLRILSNRSPMVRPVQFARKSPPASGGAISPPVSRSPWQEEHCWLYSGCPRLACASVYTPSHTEREGASCPHSAPHSAAHPSTAEAAILNFM